MLGERQDQAVRRGEVLAVSNSRRAASVRPAELALRAQAELDMQIDIRQAGVQGCSFSAAQALCRGQAASSIRHGASKHLILHRAQHGQHRAEERCVGLRCQIPRAWVRAAALRVQPRTDTGRACAASRNCRCRFERLQLRERLVDPGALRMLQKRQPQGA
ncbi:MAG: hypothetical protein ACLU3F_15595 [Blautia wexlerae]